MSDDPELVAPRAAIQTAINDHADVLANIDAQETIDNPALSEWLVLTCWTDLTTGESYIGGISSSNLLDHHRDGLLHSALYGGNWIDTNDNEDLA